MRFLSYISIMAKNLDQEGIKSIFNRYDLFFIDLWGVVHNGIELHRNAIVAIEELLKLKKNIVLLTNAPRPKETVKEFLKEMGMEEHIRDLVFTSGEAALNYLKKFYFTKKFYHIGPDKDVDLFYDFRKNQLKSLDDSHYLLCTGLYENHDKDLNHYKELLGQHINKKMICTNPDLIVDRGNQRELCAGSVAMVFEKLGGEVIYFGKPYPEVYHQSTNNFKKKILSIGDNLNTDIKGANLLNYDSLLISNGVHKSEIEELGLEKISKQYESIVNYTQSDLRW